MLMLMVALMLMQMLMACRADADSPYSMQDLHKLAVDGVEAAHMLGAIGQAHRHCDG